MVNSCIFIENDKFKIVNDNVISTKFIEDNSIDLIVTSPPYNVDIQYNSHQMEDNHVFEINQLLFVIDHLMFD